METQKKPNITEIEKRLEELRVANCFRNRGRLFERL